MKRVAATTAHTSHPAKNHPTHGQRNHHPDTPKRPAPHALCNSHDEMRERHGCPAHALSRSPIQGPLSRRDAEVGQREFHDLTEGRSGDDAAID
jgi:hypothetical protein